MQDLKERKLVAWISSVLFATISSAVVNPAFASPFTDAYGHTCDTSQLEAGGPDGQSICPGSNPPGYTPNSGVTPDIEKMLKARAIDDYEQARREALAIELLRALSNQGFLFGTPFTQGPGDPYYSHLGMYVSNGGPADAGLSGGGYSLRNGGTVLADTTGLFAPGTQSSSYRQNGAGGGISGTYDASRFVGSNQGLIFFGAFDYTSANTTFGGGSIGSSINSNNYSITSAALYRNYNNYLMLSGSYKVGDNNEFDSSDGSSGSYRTNGYDVDAKVGHIFVLWNTLSQPASSSSRVAVKAPPKPRDGYGIGLDLSGHLGYQSNTANGFTDTSGFVFGRERAQGGETGLNARLFANVQKSSVIWEPYISGSVDWRFDYSHVAYFPTQLALAAGDAVTFSDATTFVGAQIGLDVKTSNGWIVGANGFYEHSSDTEIAGGKAYVKIPFGATPVTARY